MDDGLGGDGDGDGLPEIGKNRRRFNTIKANTESKDNRGDGSKPEWNLRINGPDDRKDGAWRMLDRDKMNVNKRQLNNYQSKESISVRKNGEFDASFQPPERLKGVWRPLVERRTEKITSYNKNAEKLQEIKAG